MANEDEDIDDNDGEFAPGKKIKLETTANTTGNLPHIIIMIM